MIRQTRGIAAQTLSVELNLPPLPAALRDDPDTAEWYESLKGSLQEAFNKLSSITTTPAPSRQDEAKTKT